MVGSTFFETMEIPILAGRAIDKRDVDGAPVAAVVNQVFAEKYFRGENPVGRHFTLGGKANAADVEIVGIAREVAVLSAFGLLVGLVAAYQTTAFLKSFLFGVKPNDPFAIGASVAILIACALLAGYLPAFRASRIDPMVALRNE
jgi:ABC-type antimicrobial peptide transport system permease subunit